MYDTHTNSGTYCLHILLYHFKHMSPIQNNLQTFLLYRIKYTLLTNVFYQHNVRTINSSFSSVPHIIYYANNSHSLPYSLHTIFLTTYFTNTCNSSLPHILFTILQNHILYTQFLLTTFFTHKFSLPHILNTVL